MTDLEHQIAEHLYNTMLGRRPDQASADNCAAYLRSGRSVGDLKNEIEKSDEYLSKQTRRKIDDHPLAHIDALYKSENISYFTHRGTYRPLSLFIETVNICNNDCLICPYSSQTRRKQMMPMQLFKTIIGQYAEIGGGPVGLTPMVGELFLDKLLLQRLRLLSDSPSINSVSAISNASMFYLYSEESLKEILSHFSRLTISVYGLDRAEFKAMTQKDGYEEFLRGLSRVLSIMGPQKLTIGARHLLKRTPEQIQEWIFDLAKSAGVDHKLVQFSGTSEYANWGHFDTSIPLPMDATWMPARNNTDQCILPLISTQILSDGTVSFCGCANFDGKSDLIIGNINASSLKELLESKRTRELWNWRKCGTPEFCKTCTFHMPISVINELPNAFSDPLGAFGG